MPVDRHGGALPETGPGERTGASHALPAWWWIPPLLALAWGLNWPIVKLMLSALPPFTVRAWGLGGAALLLAAAAARRGTGLLPRRRAWPGILASGLLNVAAFNVCTAFAQLNTTTSRAAVLTYTMPIITVVLAWPFLGERPARRAALAVVIGAAGLALLAWPAFAAREARGSMLGLAMPLAASLCWAVGTLIAKRWPLVGDRRVNLAWQLAIGAGVALTGMVVAGERVVMPLPLGVWLALAFHVVIATALGYTLWFALLDRVDAGVSSMTTLAVPVVGVLGAMAVGGERPAALDWPGFAGVLAGAALVMTPRRGGVDRG